MVSTLPSRLAKRPDIQDRPPRTFSVRFHFSESFVESEEYSDENDENDENENEKKKEVEDNSVDLKSGVPNSSVVPELNYSNTIHNAHNVTNYEASSGCLPLSEKKQGPSSSGKMRISHPSIVSYRDVKRRPSPIELSFGMPISLLVLMERTVRLTDHKNWCLRKKIFPRNFPKICCDLEDDLTSWELEWDVYADNTSDKDGLKFHSLFHKALYHLVVAFHSSLLMFFNRLIKETDPVLLQNHVLTTVKHLEELKQLSLRSDFLKDMRISPPFWCFLMSGSDATTSELQYRYDELGRKWFVAGNKWIGKQVMMEVWRSRVEAEKNENTENISWLDLIKDWEISGFN